MIQTDKIPAELMQKLKNDVFEKSGVAANSLTVVRAEPVTWSDGSLGCPKPGMVYTQALVDGYWVVFRAGNTQFDYRASQSGHFTRCLESDSKPPIRHQDI